MKKIMIGVALATLLGATPAALAKDKATKPLKGADQSSMDENANRHKDADGTFQGKPVVQGPANWHSSASTGASTGEAGSSGSGSDRSMK